MTATLHHLHTRVSDALSPSSAWRWQVRRALVEVRDLLSVDVPVARDSWLAARRGGMQRERDALMARLNRLGARVLRESPREVRPEVRRLLVDVDHHLQRRRDLAWDEVELELGGSE
jgi:hypothetical protein